MHWVFRDRGSHSQPVSLHKEAGAGEQQIDHGGRVARKARRGALLITCKPAIQNEQASLATKLQ